MSNLRLSLFFILIAFVCSLAPLSADAKALILRDLPVDGDVDATDCCGEVVLIQGTAKAVVTTEDFSNFTLNVADVTGVGVDSGAEYVGIGNATQQQRVKSGGNGATVSSQRFRIRMRSDDGCSFVARAIIHVTMNANGEATADFEFVDCR